MNYYNENDPKTAAWLRELIKEKCISEGEVDDRSILEVKAHELKKYDQCHFFAGIGGWSYALRIARWADNHPVWTGSCPCQPFSTAGLGLGEEDSRHLWPTWFELIKECSPSIVFGEQVASKKALAWLDTVFLNLETQDYSCGAADLCAASKDLPHPRQRLFWVAHTNGELDTGTHLPPSCREGEIPTIWESEKIFQKGQRRIDELVTRHITERVSSYPEARFMLDGIPARMEQMRGAGNAIVPQVAAEFIQTCWEAIQPHGRPRFPMNDPAFQ